MIREEKVLIDEKFALDKCTRGKGRSSSRGNKSLISLFVSEKGNNLWRNSSDTLFISFSFFFLSFSFLSLLLFLSKKYLRRKKKWEKKNEEENDFRGKEKRESCLFPVQTFSITFYVPLSPFFLPSHFFFLSFSLSLIPSDRSRFHWIENFDT